VGVLATGSNVIQQEGGEKLEPECPRGYLRVDCSSARGQGAVARDTCGLQRVNFWYVEKNFLIEEGNNEGDRLGMWGSVTEVQLILDRTHLILEESRKALAKGRCSKYVLISTLRKERKGRKE